MFLVEVYRHDVESNRGMCFQRQQHVEQSITVLAARQADHDLVAVFDHAEVADGLTHLLEQFCLCLSLYKQLSDPPPKAVIFSR